MQTVRGTILLGVLVLGLTAERPVAAQPGKPVLSGLWRFNPEKSTQPGEHERERERGMSSGRVGGPPPLGRGGPPPDATVLLGFMKPVLQILIQQTDSTIAISDATGQLATFPTDGRTIREPQLVGEDVEIGAKWKDGRLTIERKLPDIGTVKETYSVDPAARALVLVVRISGPRLARAVEMRRVYDPSPEEK